MIERFKIGLRKSKVQRHNAKTPSDKLLSIASVNRALSLLSRIFSIAIMNKEAPQVSPQNRPYVITSEPANGNGAHKSIIPFFRNQLGPPSRSTPLAGLRVIIIGRIEVIAEGPDKSLSRSKAH
jgi:hypothetical protein